MNWTHITCPACHRLVTIAELRKKQTAIEVARPGGQGKSWSRASASRQAKQVLIELLEQALTLLRA